MKEIKKFEKIFFNLLTTKYKFFMRNYYSKFNIENKWIGLLDNNNVYIAAVVVEDLEEDIAYSEIKDYLSKTLNKPFIINLIVLSSNEYVNLESNYYNKIVFSLNERKVIYCSEGSKGFLPIFDNILTIDTKKEIDFKKYKFTYSLIIINIIIFFIEILRARSIIDIDIYTLIEMGAKVNPLINRGEIYRFITAGFLHGGIIHIFFNMSALNIIGKEVESIFGGKKFLQIYILSALGGNLFSYLFSPRNISVGASGAIFGLLGAMLIFGLKERYRIGKSYVKNIIQTIGLNIILGITIPNIDNFAHIGGLVIGSLTTYLIYKKLQKI